MTAVLPDPASMPDPAPSPVTPAAEPWVRRTEVRAAGIVVLASALLGVAAGLVWWVWSPSRGIALALDAHTYIPDETEAFIGADGRFTVIAVALGVVTGGLTYCWRSVRGPLVGLALGVGSVLCSLIAGLLGEALGGGSTGGAARTIIIPRLEVRADVLFVAQAMVALLVYGVLVTMSARDDLGVSGRPTPPSANSTDPDPTDADPTGRAPFGPPPGH